MKKILAFTTIRSDYDLLSPLFFLLNDDKEIDFRLIVAGAHLSDSYGRSVDLIEKDNLNILLKIETLINSNSSPSRLKSASILLINAIDIVAQFNPDLILYSGDREDVIIGALLGSYLQIPTMHFFGGDHTEDGHVDNPVRHATSKLSTIHMVANKDHNSRLILMGENPQRIFNIGSIALDKILKHKVKKDFDVKKIFNLGEGFDQFALVIFHPHDQEKTFSHIILKNILESLKSLNINAFVSYPNTDPGNLSIINELEQYQKDKQFYFYKNLPRDVFLSLLKTCIFQIGNSSSGIIESASIPIPAVNVGMRQLGRAANKNVIFCGTSISDIRESIEKALSDNFIVSIKNIKNIYGDGKSAQRAFQIIKDNDFKNFIYKTEDVLKKYKEWALHLS